MALSNSKGRRKTKLTATRDVTPSTNDASRMTRAVTDGADHDEGTEKQGQDACIRAADSWSRSRFPLREGTFLSTPGAELSMGVVSTTTMMTRCILSYSSSFSSTSSISCLATTCLACFALQGVLVGAAEGGWPRAEKGEYPFSPSCPSDCGWLPFFDSATRDGDACTSTRNNISIITTTI